MSKGYPSTIQHPGKLAAVGLVTACLLGGASPAQAFEDWYITGFGGAQFMDGIDVFHADRFTNIFGAACIAIAPCVIPDWEVRNGADMKTDTGFLAGVAIGANATDHLRTEVELSFSHNSLDEAAVRRNFFPTVPITQGTAGDQKASGRLNTYAVLVNGWFDIPVQASFQPYAGGGVGVGIVQTDASWGSFISPNIPPKNPAVNGYNFTDVGFAWQVGAGVRVPMNDSLMIDVGYRYRGIEGIKFKPDITTLPTVKRDVRNHVVQVGLSWQLP